MGSGGCWGGVWRGRAGARRRGAGTGPGNGDCGDARRLLDAGRLGGTRREEEKRRHVTGNMGFRGLVGRHTLSTVASAMAQAATMGPPLSPREIRRSGRRSAPSASTSASKSPDADLPPRQKENPQRAPPSSSASSRSKRTKDDADDHPDDRKHSATVAHSSASSSNSSNPKGKRKHKEKDKQRLSIDVTAETLQDPVDDKTADPPEEEEQGITRCVCGSNGTRSPSPFSYHAPHMLSRRRRSRCR